MLDQSKLNDMWQGGFCSKVIEQARFTQPGRAGSHSRIAFMKEHLDDCPDCQNANTLKNLEGTVAKMVGNYVLFESGGDILQNGDEKTKKALEVVLKAAVASGLIDFSFIFWMKKIATRHGHPYEAEKRSP